MINYQSLDLHSVSAGLMFSIKGATTLLGCTLSLSLNSLNMSSQAEFVAETLEAMQLLATSPALWQVIFPSDLPWSEESRIAVLNRELEDVEAARELAGIEAAQADLHYQYQCEELARRHQMECAEAMLSEAEFDVASPPVIDLSEEEVETVHNFLNDVLVDSDEEIVYLCRKLPHF